MIVMPLKIFEMSAHLGVGVGVLPACYEFSVVCRRVLDMRRHVYAATGVRDASGLCWSAVCHSGASGVERSLSLPRTIFRIVTNELCGRFLVNMSAY